ncbi:hypothetical protein [Methylobacterium oryzisoli]|uniref:hypothetical protein n=1 Tax=Methylobacterium oryzisoli TaxID=3385502 RepID=UPI003892561F
MSVISLERRLRRIEKRPAGVSFFLVWGKTPEEAQDAMRVAGVGEAVLLIWPHSDPVPPSRRVVFDDDGGSLSEMTSQERAILRNAIEAELAARVQ